MEQMRAIRQATTNPGLVVRVLVAPAAAAADGLHRQPLQLLLYRYVRHGGVPVDCCCWGIRSIHCVGGCQSEERREAGERLGSRFDRFDTPTLQLIPFCPNLNLITHIGLQTGLNMKSSMDSPRSIDRTQCRRSIAKFVLSEHHNAPLTFLFFFLFTTIPTIPPGHGRTHSTHKAAASDQWGGSTTRTRARPRRRSWRGSSRSRSASSSGA